MLEGQIERGDYDKLRNFLADRTTFDKIQQGIFLASPGGDVMEAVRMGYLIRSLKLITLLPALPGRSGGPIQPRDLRKRGNYFCASACFFLYVAGIDRNPPQLVRLGIHRPVIRLQFNMDVSEKKKENADRRMEDILSFYAHQMDVPHHLLSVMLSVAPDSIHWLNDDEFSEYVRWTSPELRSEIRRRCEIAKGVQSNSINLIVCRHKVANDLAAQGWINTYKPQ